MIYERLKGSGHLTQAQAMVAARPGFLAGSAALTTAWLRDARPDQLPSFVALLEGAISLEAPPTPRLNRGLAALYMRWSDAEANAAAPDTAARVAHLVRAQELAPGDFEVARRLASLCWETHQPERAAAALEPFLAADAVPGERTQARELLAKH
jgi:hypothetical protein